MQPCQAMGLPHGTSIGLVTGWQSSLEPSILPLASWQASSPGVCETQDVGCLSQKRIPARCHPVEYSCNDFMQHPKISLKRGLTQGYLRRGSTLALRSCTASEAVVKQFRVSCTDYLRYV